jgi:hypothetical protein
MNPEFSRKILEKQLNVKFHDNSSNGGRVVPCGETDRHMTKLIVVFRNFVKAPKTYRTKVDKLKRKNPPYDPATRRSLLSK